MPTTKVPKVLVVEDEMVLRMRAVDIVEDAGFYPVEAVNADEAISILESRSDISLLFTDIQMPGSMDGLKLAHAVHERWPAIKIILVSGRVTPTDAEKPKDSHFFGKPLGVEQMIAELQSMVGAGEGLALLPRFTTRPNPATVLRPLSGVNSQRAIVALARPDHYARRAVRTVADLLADVGAELMHPTRVGQGVQRLG